MDIVSQLLLGAFGLYLLFRLLDRLVTGPAFTVSFENACSTCGRQADLITRDQCSFCVDAHGEEADSLRTELYSV